MTFCIWCVEKISQSSRERQVYLRFITFFPIYLTYGGLYAKLSP